MNSCEEFLFTFGLDGETEAFPTFVVILYEDGNELPPDDPDDFFVHVAFKLISSVIGVEKSKVFPSLCHSLNLYPLLVGFDGLVSFSPLLTS